MGERSSGEKQSKYQRRKQRREEAQRALTTSLRTQGEVSEVFSQQYTNRRITKKGRNRFVVGGFTGLALVVAIVAGVATNNGGTDADSSKDQGELITNPDFPEMNGFQVIQRGEFSTTDHRDIDWFNYSYAHVDEANLQALYEVLEEPGLVPSKLFPDGKVDRSARKKIVLNFVNADHPLVKLNVTGGLATTDEIQKLGEESAFTFQPRDGQFTTYLRLDPTSAHLLDHNPDTTHLDGNGLLYIEACQATFSPSARGLQLAIARKEALCNSFGFMVDLGTNGYRYADYRLIALQGTMTIGNTQITIPLLPEQTFNKLSGLHKPLSKS